MTKRHPIQLANASRERGNRYHADLLVHGTKVGTVQRGWTQGGAYNSQYLARVEGTAVAMAHTLADLRVDLAEWYAEEQHMEDDAVWLRKARDDD